MMVIDLRTTLYVHNIKPAFRSAMLHAYMLYHSTYKDIINENAIASAEIRVELYKIGLLRTIHIYFLVIETFLNNVI